MKKTLSTTLFTLCSVLLIGQTGCSKATIPSTQATVLPQYNQEISTKNDIGTITEPYGIVVGQTTLAEVKKLLLDDGWQMKKQESDKGRETSIYYKFIQIPSAVHNDYYFNSFKHPNNENRILLFIDDNLVVQRLGFFTQDKITYDKFINAIRKFQNKPKASIFKHFYSSNQYINLSHDELIAETSWDDEQFQYGDLVYLAHQNKMGIVTMTQPIKEFIKKHTFNNTKVFEIPQSVTGDLIWEEVEDKSMIMTIVSEKYIHDYDQPICTVIVETKDTEKRTYLLSNLPQDVCQ